MKAKKTEQPPDVYHIEFISSADTRNETEKLVDDLLAQMRFADRLKLTMRHDDKQMAAIGVAARTWERAAHLLAAALAADRTAALRSRAGMTVEEQIQESINTIACHQSRVKWLHKLKREKNPNPQTKTKK